MDIVETVELCQEIEETLVKKFNEAHIGSVFKSLALSFIAGGCIRDSLLRREIADIDIYTEKRFWPSLDWETYNPDSEKYKQGHIDGLFNTDWEVRGKKIQLISRPNDRISISTCSKNHPLTLSNCYYVDGQLVLDKNFVKSVKEQKLYVGKEVKDFDYIDDYIKKIQRKYDWPLVKTKAMQYRELFI